eukprot:1392135-Prymnesium_polylepis.1
MRCPILVCALLAAARLSAAWQRELDAALRRRRARLGAPLLRALFGSGGYRLDTARAHGCALPASIDPRSASRFWAGLQVERR